MSESAAGESHGGSTYPVLNKNAGPHKMIFHLHSIVNFRSLKTSCEVNVGQKTRTSQGRTERTILRECRGYKN